MMQAPHIKSLGQAISVALRSERENVRKTFKSSYSPLHILQSGPSWRAPLFCIPGAGDSVATFVDLAEHFGSVWPTYAFQPRGIEGELIPHSTATAAAEFYLNALNVKYPEGPVHLLGHSFGGWVAFELAQLLINSGRPIGSVTLLDSSAPDDRDAKLREYTTTEVLGHWIAGVELLLGRPMKVSLSDLDDLEEADSRRLLHTMLVHEGILPRHSDSECLRGPLRSFAMSLRSRYTPQERYSGPLRIVFADDPRADDSANLLAYERRRAEWQKWAPNLKCTRTPANHFTMLKPPYVDLVARLLRQELNDISGESAFRDDQGLISF